MPEPAARREFSLDQFQAEFADLEEHPGVVLRLGAVEAWAVLGQLQLACRHPANNGPTRQIAEQVARQLQAAVATTPALRVVAEMGWDPAYDEEPSP